MKGFLNQSQIEYVLFHLSHHVDLNDQIRKSFIFAKPEEDILRFPNRIIFLLSGKEYHSGQISYLGDVPVLFPVSGEFFSYKSNNGSIIFTCDLLKSAFYLLSGYQERSMDIKDPLGRFPFEASVQSQLNIISRPVVNYYFSEIISGIREFCRIHSLKYTEKKPFNKLAFFLTHDVDRISYYNFNNLLYTIKLFTGITKTERDRLWHFKEFFRIGWNLLNPFCSEDPYWNFAYMSGIEKKMGIHSTWFFLPADQKHADSYYNLNDKKIKTLIKFLISEGHESALHGTLHSHNSPEALRKILVDFLMVSGRSETGIRQHRLLWKHPDTGLIHEKEGIIYDTTLGFAAHEGFRNSYCHPFRLFDFDNNRMLGYWEIPLTLMESTLFNYRKLDFKQANDSILSLIKEIKKFNGVFTLLWHNSYLNEHEKSGITEFYQNILEEVISEKAESLTGLEIIKRMKSGTNNE